MDGTISSGINHHRVSLIVTDLYVPLDEFLAFSHKSHTRSNVTVIHPTVAGNFGKHHFFLREKSTSFIKKESTIFAIVGDKTARNRLFPGDWNITVRCSFPSSQYL
jgi:hypothetical protein